MKHFITAFLCLVLVIPVFAQQSITMDDLKGKSGSIVMVVKKTGFDNSVYLDKKIRIPTEDETLAAFVTQYEGYLDMMKSEYITVNSDEFKFTKDSAKLQVKFAEKLKEDPLFNQYFLPLIATFYQSKGYTITGYNFEKPSYTFDELMDVIVKYYEVTAVDSRGNFSTRVAISDNGLVNTLSARRPLLESYGLYFIRQNKYKAFRALEKAQRVISKLELGLRDGDKIKRAEGALYALISQDETLRSLLKADYEKNAAGLPFVITF